MKHYCIMVLCFAASLHAQITGCTDPQSTNYNPQATVNNGSCQYPQSFATIISSTALSSLINETSGICISGSEFITHNDNLDQNLYRIDHLGTIMEQIPTDIVNIDWEEIAEDGQYLYLGDFGNNVTGTRQNLKIYRILKESIDANIQVDVIAFSYEDQFSFMPAAANSTEFDCEAFIVRQDKIYLFTKKWNSQTTTVYEVPNMPGSHVAVKGQTFNVNGLITGATFVEGKQLVALCGYSNSLQPFVWLLYGFYENDFFSGNKRKINLDLPLHQIEAITSFDGETFFVTNERFQFGSMAVPSKLHTLDLSDFTQEIQTSLSQNENEICRADFVYNPARRTIELKNIVGKISIYDCTGKLVYHGNSPAIDASGFSDGIYVIADAESRRSKTIAVY